MRKTTRRALAIAAVVIVAVAGYFAYRYIGASLKQVPQEFSDARSKGGVIAEDIVQLSDQIKSDIIRINDLDKQRNYKDARTVVGETRVKVGQLRTRALDLAKELERMTQAISQIRSSEARKAATDSVMQRLELIKHLITYSEKVTALLDALESHFTGAKNEKEIEQLLIDVNNEVTAINEYNRQASESIQRFDDLVK